MITESVIEDATISWFKDLGYTYAYGKDIEPEGTHQECETFEQVALPERLRDSLAWLMSGQVRVKPI